MLAAVETTSGQSQNCRAPFHSPMWQVAIPTLGSASAVPQNAVTGGWLRSWGIGTPSWHSDMIPGPCKQLLYTTFSLSIHQSDGYSDCLLLLIVVNSATVTMDAQMFCWQNDFICLVCISSSGNAESSVNSLYVLEELWFCFPQCLFSHILLFIMCKGSIFSSSLPVPLISFCLFIVACVTCVRYFILFGCYWFKGGNIAHQLLHSSDVCSSNSWTGLYLGLPCGWQRPSHFRVHISVMLASRLVAWINAHPIICIFQIISERFFFFLFLLVICMDPMGKYVFKADSF